MPINVSRAINTYTSELLTVERPGAGRYVDGIYTAGDTTTFRSMCSVQQPSADEIQNLPEGERNKNIRKFISKRPLRTTGDREGIEADVVLYKGSRYKIIQIEDWDVFGHTTAFGAEDE